VTKGSRRGDGGIGRESFSDLKPVGGGESIPPIILILLGFREI